MLPSSCHHDFALYLSSLMMLVYKELALRRDLSELEEPSAGLPSVICLLPAAFIQ
jgi:hypothetical protein